MVYLKKKIEENAEFTINDNNGLKTIAESLSNIIKEIKTYKEYS